MEVIDYSLQHQGENLKGRNWNFLPTRFSAGIMYHGSKIEIRQ